MSSNWISAHIFHNQPFEKVLVNLIHPILETLTNKKLSQQFFFIRYWEGGPHIRLRVKPTHENYHEEIKIIINTLSKNYFETENTGDVKYNIEFPAYTQELERYGGTAAIAIAEKHFGSSSGAVLHLLKKHEEKWDYNLAISLAIQMHLVFCRAAGMDFNESLGFFNFFYGNWLYYSLKIDDGKNDQEEIAKEVQKTTQLFQSSYQTQKDSINLICQTIWKETSFDENPWMKSWYEETREVIGKLKAQQSKGLLELPTWANPNLDIPKDRLLLWITNYELRITNYELRITNYELRITNYELRITNYELRITNYELRITVKEISAAPAALGSTAVTEPKPRSSLTWLKCSNNL